MTGGEVGVGSSESSPGIKTARRTISSRTENVPMAINNFEVLKIERKKVSLAPVLIFGLLE